MLAGVFPQLSVFQASELYVTATWKVSNTGSQPSACLPSGGGRDHGDKCSTVIGTQQWYRPARLARRGQGSAPPKGWVGKEAGSTMGGGVGGVRKTHKRKYPDQFRLPA